MKSSVENVESFEAYRQSYQQKMSCPIHSNLQVKSAHSFHFLCRTRNPILNR